LKTGHTTTGMRGDVVLVRLEPTSNVNRFTV